MLEQVNKPPPLSCSSIVDGWGPEPEEYLRRGKDKSQMQSGRFQDLVLDNTGTYIS